MLNSTSKTTMIVPCAGFGRRVGSPPAKELLINPQTQAPLIDSCLQIAERHQWHKVLVTRPEKKVLMDYVTAHEARKSNPSQWVLVQKTSEWPESVLKSANHWSEKNILILPDTTWAPTGIEAELIADLDHCDISFGVFETHEQSTWGTVAITENSLRLCEKPLQSLPDFQAWGLIAFKKNIGKVLFKALLDSTLDHQIKSLHLKTRATLMTSFADLTRPS